MPGLEVWPAQNNQGWVVQEFPEGKLSAGGDVAVSLQQGVSIQGSVHAASTATEQSKLLIPARIVAYRDSLLPGRPKVQFETVQEPAKEDGSANYVLWVNRGHTYTFYVAPQEPYAREYPPLVKTNVRVDGHLVQDFAVEGAVRVIGQIQIAPTGTLLPAGLKVRVRAYRPGGLEQSTVAETSISSVPAQHGLFDFRVPAGVLTYTVRVETAVSTMPIPTVECTGRVLGLGEPPTPEMPQLPYQNIGVVYLPSFTVPTQPFTVVVQGKDGSAVANAKVTFTTPLIVPPGLNVGFDSCSANFSQSGLTDADGKVELYLLAADSSKENRFYSVTVVSPPNSHFSSQRLENFEVGPSPGVLQAIQLQDRYRLTGRVVSSDGTPVPRAALEAQAIAGQDDAAAVSSEASSTASADGTFTLFMDAGTYNIDVRPPDGNGLPATCLKEFTVAGDQGWKEVALPSAQALRGHVTVAATQGQVELSNAQVNVYEQVQDTASTQRADLRAMATTDHTGLFYLLLPAP